MLHKISVCILKTDPTNQHLIKLLKCLEYQKENIYEIIYSGRNDSTCAVNDTASGVTPSITNIKSQTSNFQFPISNFKSLNLTSGNKALLRNKCLKEITGDYILWCNNEMEPGTSMITEFIDVIEKFDDVNILYPNEKIKTLENNEQIHKSYKDWYQKNSELIQELTLEDNLPEWGVLTKTNIFNKFGLFNEDYEDYEFYEYLYKNLKNITLKLSNMSFVNHYVREDFVDTSFRSKLIKDIVITYDLKTEIFPKLKWKEEENLATSTAYSTIGEKLFKYYDYFNAVKFFEKASSYFNNQAITKRLIECYQNMGNFEMAKNLISTNSVLKEEKRKQLSSNLQKIKDLTKTLEKLLEENKTEQALIIADDIVQQGYNIAPIINLLGEIFCVKEKFDLAYKCFYTATIMNPLNKNILKNLFGASKIFDKEKKVIKLMNRLLTLPSSCHSEAIAEESLIQEPLKDENISDCIFEYFIKPNEIFYMENFNKNINLLKKYNLLFTKLSFDFEHLKKNISLIENYQMIGHYYKIIDKIIESKKDDESITIILVDAIDLQTIQKLLDKNFTLYLIYDDLGKFFYLSSFENLERLSQYIEAKKMIFFVGRDLDILKRFFSNSLIPPPSYVMDYSTQSNYSEIISKTIKENYSKITFYIEELNKYYGNKDAKYYKSLFLKNPSSIKIMLITSQITTLNKHICNNWYHAFLELGYNAKFIIESEPYQFMNAFYIIEQTYNFKPDIIFHINYGPGNFFKDEEIKNSLLWIMRHRDYSAFNMGENTFGLPVIKEFTKDLEKANLPKNRIFYIPDGVDFNVFSKKDTINKYYACDVVIVNNAAGNETFQLNYHLKSVKDSETKNIILELYTYIEEISLNEKFIFFDNSFEKILDQKVLQRGLQVTESWKKFVLRFCAQIMNTIYRKKVMEWIIDSKITDDIKVWGKGWPNIEKFKKYHMGTAKWGEELAEVYRSSKISISDQPLVSLHERNFEILASGGFPLVKHIQPENNEDIDLITNYFKENEEIVVFYNKDDLLNKIQCYLDNPKERERIAENGRKIVLQNFSNVAIAKKTIDFIKEYYKNL